MAASKQRRWKCLLDKNRQGTLTEPEQRELGQFTGGAGRLAPYSSRSLAVIVLSTNSLADASAERGGCAAGLDGRARDGFSTRRWDAFAACDRLRAISRVRRLE